MSRRIGDATNLEVFPENEASEIYQVANYGMAGRYSPHTDYITGEDHLHNPLEHIRGNRIATFMIYVSQRFDEFKIPCCSCRPLWMINFARKINEH